MSFGRAVPVDLLLSETSPSEEAVGASLYLAAVPFQPDFVLLDFLSETVPAASFAAASLNCSFSFPENFCVNDWKVDFFSFSFFFGSTVAASPSHSKTVE